MTRWIPSCALAVVGDRRRSLPKFVKAVLNLTWLQLHQLKLEFGPSWNTAAARAMLLFPGLHGVNARHLMERADCGFAKTHHKEAYLSQTMNLDAIGPYHIVHLHIAGH